MILGQISFLDNARAVFIKDDGNLYPKFEIGQNLRSIWKSRKIILLIYEN